MRTLIFLNGRIPKLRVVNHYKKKNCFIIAADGGANSLKRIGIKPDIIIGDLDSISKNALSFYIKRKIPVIQITDQNTTDLEKCLIYCLKKNPDEIYVFGATSLRTDHTLNNLSILKRFYKKLEIKIITEEFEIFFIRNKVNFNYKTGEIVSLLAMPLASGISTSGLEYPLKHETLEFGVREGALNKSVSKNVSVSFTKGNLLLFKKYFI